MRPLSYVRRIYASVVVNELILLCRIELLMNMWWRKRLRKQQWRLKIISQVTITGWHYGDAIMGAIASQITSLTIVYSTVYSDADKNKHQSSASLAFVQGIHRVPVNSPHKWPVTRKMFPFDDVIMGRSNATTHTQRRQAIIWTNPFYCAMCLHV